jgi:hypothetical protein
MNSLSGVETAGGQIKLLLMLYVFIAVLNALFVTFV